MSHTSSSSAQYKPRLQGICFLLIVFGVFLLPSTRSLGQPATSADYQIPAATVASGGTSYSSHYGNLGSVESVAGVSVGTLPDATARLLWHGFVPQLSPPLFPSGDLSLGLDISPSIASPQEWITLTVRITNSGVAISTGVRLTATLPVNAAVQGMNSSQGTSRILGSELQWDVGVLGPGLAATCTVRVLPTALGMLCFRGTVAAAALDLAPEDNVASVDASVVAAIQFIGKVDGQWLNPANWSPPIVPGETNKVIVLNGTVDYWDVDATVAALELRGGKISASRGRRRLTVTKLATWGGGELQGLDLVIPKSSQLIASNTQPVHLSSGAGIWNEGLVRLESTALQAINGAWVTNGGIFEIVDKAGLLRFEQTLFLFKNLKEGTFRKRGGSIPTAIPIEFQNEGFVEVQAGSLDFNATFVNGGLSLVNSGRLMAWAETEIKYTRANRFLNGTVFEGPGLHRIVAATSGPADGSLFSGDIQGSFQVENGRMSGSFTNSGVLRWIGGVFQSYLDVLTIAPGGSLIVGGQGGRTLVNLYSVRNFGTLILASAGLDASGGGIIDNHALLDLASDAGIGSDITLSNGTAGIVLKSAGTGVSALPKDFIEQGGLIEVRSGTIALRGDYSPSKSSKLRLHLGGVAPATQYTGLQIAGDARLQGSLELIARDGFLPDPSSSFPILSARSRKGEFTEFKAPALPNGLSMSADYLVNGVSLRMVSPPPVLNPSSFQFFKDRVTFVFEGVPGGTYVLEGSPDLYSWQPLKTNLINLERMTVEDLERLPQRFYRILLIPTP